MAIAFGSCGDRFVTWDDSQFDSNGNPIVVFTSADGEETLRLCLNPVKGASIDGIPVANIDGVLQLPVDMFGSMVVSGTPGTPDHTLTITFPGQAPQAICLSPVKTVSGDGVDNTDPLNPVITQGTVAESADGTSGTVTDFAGTSCEFLKASAYNPSSTVPDGNDPAIRHTITTSDGVATSVCLNPIKTINGVAPDINGEIGVSDLFSTTTDNGDGSFTTTNPDGTAVTWTGDTFATQMDNGDGTVTFTMADASTVTLCLNPVKGLQANPDGSFTVVFADGSLGTTIPAGAQSAIDNSAPGVATHDDGQGNTYDLQEPLTDGGSIILAADGVTINPILDCDGAPITLPVGNNRFPTFRQMRDDLEIVHEILYVPADPALECEPVDPTDKQIRELRHMRTVNPRGDMYEWSVNGGAAWVLSHVNPSSRLGSYPFGGSVTVTDAELAANQAAGFPWEDVFVTRQTFTNNDCVSWYIRGHIRTMAQMVGFAENMQVLSRIFQTAADTTLAGAGSPNSSYETRGIQHDNMDHQEYLHTFWQQRIDPGQTLISEYAHQFRCSAYAADPNQRFVSNGMGGRWMMWRGDRTLENQITVA